MDKYEKVTKGIECCHLICEHGCNICPYYSEGDCVENLARDTLALWKAQKPTTIEPKRIELADETKAWLDTMDAVDALGNIADICIDWDGYRTVDGLGGLINEIWAYARYCANRLARAQEPVKPLFSRFYNNDIVIYKCGACGKEIGAEGLPKYCMHCGREVKWE